MKEFGGFTPLEYHEQFAVAEASSEQGGQQQHSVRRQLKLGAVSCALAVIPFAAVETNIGDTPLAHECRVTVTEKTKDAVEDLLNNPLAPRVTKDSYTTGQVQQYIQGFAAQKGLHVFSPQKTLDTIAKNNQTLVPDVATSANFAAAKAFLAKYGVELGMPDSPLEGTMLLRGFSPAQQEDVKSPVVQDMLPRLVRTFSFMPVEYVRDIAKIDKVSFVTPWDKQNITLAYADEVQATGERVLYMNTIVPFKNIATSVDNPFPHEIAHHAMASMCGTSLRGFKHDPQLAAENPGLPYTKDTANYSPQQSARGAHGSEPQSTDKDTDFVSRYAGTTQNENEAELLSYITTPPNFDTATSERFPKVRKQAAHVLGLLYQKNPRIAEYFAGIGNRK